MAYTDRSVIPMRHIGRMKPAGIGIRAYVDPQVAIAGTATVTPTEGEVITGTQTITLTLANGRWPSGAPFDAIRQSLINGLDSNKAEATGWDTKIKAALAVTDVVRTSATIATITLPAAPTYQITADEVISFTLPQGAVVGGAPGRGDVTVTIVNASPTVTAALTGTFLTTPTEGEVVTGGQTIIITLTGGIWVPTGASFNAQRQSIIDGLVSGGAEAGGWNLKVKAVMAVTTVVRTSDVVATVTLPATGDYSITANETVTVTVPRLAIATADAAVVATPTIVIVAS